MASKNEATEWDEIRELAESIDKLWRDKVDDHAGDDREDWMSTEIKFPAPLGVLKERSTDPYASHYTNDSRTMGVPQLMNDYSAPFRPDNFGTEQVFYQHWDLAYPKAEEDTKAHDYGNLSLKPTLYAQYCVPTLTSPFPVQETDYQYVGEFTYSKLYNDTNEGLRASVLNALMLMENPRHAVRKFWHDDVNGVGYGATDTESGFYEESPTYSAELFLASEGKDQDDVLVICRNVTRVCPAVADGNGNLNNNNSSHTDVEDICPSGSDYYPVDTATSAQGNDSLYRMLYTLTERGWGQMKPTCNVTANTYTPPPIGCCADVWFPRLGEELSESPDGLDSWFPFRLFDRKNIFSDTTDFVAHMKKVVKDDAIRYARSKFGIELKPELADDAPGKHEADLHVYRYALDSAGGKHYVGVRISLLGFGRTFEPAEDIYGNLVDDGDTHDWRWCITGITVGIKGKLFPAIRKRWWDMMYYKLRCAYGYLYKNPQDGLYRAIGVTPDNALRAEMTYYYNWLFADKLKYSEAWLANRLLGLNNASLGSCGMFYELCDSQVDGSGKTCAILNQDHGEYSGSKKLNMIEGGEKDENPMFHETAYFGIPYFERFLCAFNADYRKTTLLCDGTDNTRWSEKGGYCSETLPENAPKYGIETSCAKSILLPWNGGCGNEDTMCMSTEEANMLYRTYAFSVNALKDIVSTVSNRKLKENSLGLKMGDTVYPGSTLQLDAFGAEGRIQFPWLPEDKYALNGVFPGVTSSGFGKGTSTVPISGDNIKHIENTADATSGKATYELDCSLDYKAEGSRVASYLIQVPIFANEDVYINLKSEGAYKFMPLQYSNVESLLVDSMVYTAACLPKDEHYHTGVISTNYLILPDTHQVEAVRNCVLDAAGCTTAAAPSPIEYGDNNSLFSKTYFPIYNGKGGDLKNATYTAYGYDEHAVTGVPVGYYETYYGYYTVGVSDSMTSDYPNYPELACITDIVAKYNHIKPNYVDVGKDFFEYGEIDDYIKIDKDKVNEILRGSGNLECDIYNGTLVIAVTTRLQEDFTYAGMVKSCGYLPLTANDTLLPDWSEVSSCGYKDSTTRYPSKFSIPGDSNSAPFPFLAHKGVKLTVTVSSKPLQSASSDSGGDPEFDPVEVPDCLQSKPNAIGENEGEDDKHPPVPWTPRPGPSPSPSPNPFPPHSGWNIYYEAGDNCEIDYSRFKLVGDELYPEFYIQIPNIHIPTFLSSTAYDVTYEATPVGVGACTYNGECQDNPARGGFDANFNYGIELEHPSNNCEGANSTYAPIKTSTTGQIGVLIKQAVTGIIRFNYTSFEVPPTIGVQSNYDGVTFEDTGRLKNVTIKNVKTGTRRTEQMRIVLVHGRPNIIRKRAVAFLKNHCGVTTVANKVVNKSEGTQVKNPDINAICVPQNNGREDATLRLPKTSRLKLRFEQDYDPSTGSGLIEYRRFRGSNHWQAKEYWDWHCGNQETGIHESAELDIEFTSSIIKGKQHELTMPVISL